MSIFSENKNKYFVETGTCLGGGVLRALEAGFENIRSIELSEKLHKYAKEHNENSLQVKLYIGDSTLILWDVIKDIEDQITFLLDAHDSSGITVHNGKFEVELFKELEAIAKHPIKTHTIMIDDYNGYVNCGLKEIILKINPDYKFKFGTYAEHNPNDVLIAYI